MNVEEWQRLTNAGTLAQRTRDLQQVDQVLGHYLANRTLDNLGDLTTTLGFWQRDNVQGRALMFSASTSLLERFIEAERSFLTNKAAATAAYAATRAYYAHDNTGQVVKSSNKQIFMFDNNALNTTAHMLKVAASSLRHDRAMHAQITLGRNNPAAQATTYPAAARAATTGNCGEMSEFSRDYILGMANHPPVSRFGFRYRQGVQAADPDHVFCVVGSPVNNVGTEVQVNEALPVDMAAWPADLWIVDAWATICCAATDYLTKFQAKAEEWSTKGLKIAYSGHWVDPSSPLYVNSLRFADKKRQH